jgi:hypothetical protein
MNDKIFIYREYEDRSIYKNRYLDEPTSLYIKPCSKVRQIVVYDNKNRKDFSYNYIEVYFEDEDPINVFIGRLFVPIEFEISSDEFTSATYEDACFYLDEERKVIEHKIGDFILNNSIVDFERFKKFIKDETEKLINSNGE